MLVGGGLCGDAGLVVWVVERSGAGGDGGDAEGDVDGKNAGGGDVVATAPVPPTRNWFGSIV